AAHRPEGERGRGPQDDRGDRWHDRDQVADQLEDEADDRDAVEELVHQRTTVSPLYDFVIVGAASIAAGVPRRRSSRRITGVATRTRRIVAWTTSTSSAGIPALICIRPAPLRIAPNRRAAGRTPNGFD